MPPRERGVKGWGRAGRGRADRPQNESARPRPGDPVYCGGIRSNPTACARGIRSSGRLPPCLHLRPVLATGASQDPWSLRAAVGLSQHLEGPAHGPTAGAEGRKDRSLRLAARQTDASDCECTHAAPTRVFLVKSGARNRATGCGGLRRERCETGRPHGDAPCARRHEDSGPPGGPEPAPDVHQAPGAISRFWMPASRVPRRAIPVRITYASRVAPTNAAWSTRAKPPSSTRPACFR